FTLLDLEREQIEKFLNGWCPAVERFLSPDTSDEELARRAQAEIDGILKSVDGNTGVKRLATNPLLLTILALIHHSGARLPSRRVELYELATNSLLSDWLAAKGMGSGKHISRADAAQFLWPLAFWMHSERPSGLAYEQEVEEKLRQFRARDTGKPPDHPEVIAAVDDFMARASRSTGIFVLRAPKQFGFLHLTFQEYFAALELTRSSLQMARRIHEVRHKPRWEEPILLAIASRQSPDDANMLVRTAILAEGELAEQQGFKPSEYEDILHRDLFLAARCLADDVPVYPELRQQIVNRLCELYFDPKSPWSLKEDIRQSFALLGGSNATDDLIEILLGRINDSEAYVRSAAARALGVTGKETASDQVITALTTHLEDPEQGVRDEVKEALDMLGKKEPRLQSWRVVSDMLPQLRATPLAQAIIKMADNHQFITTLTECLADPRWEVRYTTAIALGVIGEKSARDQAINDLIKGLADSDENVRFAAAISLSTMGEKGLGSLVQLLNSSDAYVRYAAAIALELMGESAVSDQVITSLIKCLGDSDENVRYATARALGVVSKKIVNDEFIIALTERLSYSEWYIREAAAIVLQAMGERAGSDQVISSLIQLLADPDRNVRYAAARAQGVMGKKGANEKVLESLIQLLNDSDWNVRDAAVEALGKLVSHVREEAKPAIIKLALP
ncbi:MAG: HEAT repeat domain-containing protein, partial [Acidobacteriota bacterium]